MKIKVSETTPLQLNWLVAKCLYLTGYHTSSSGFSPSTNWSQGGPIIEREGLTVSDEGTMWSSYIRKNLFKENGSECWQTGPTPLIAAMRCYCASKLSDEVEIPEKLL